MAGRHNRRDFSSSMHSTNQAFLSNKAQPENPVNVAFVLPDHFSMMTYTTAVDALVTTNLVKSSAVFDYQTFSLNEDHKVISDIAIEISTSNLLNELAFKGEKASNVLIFCGGFRCDLSENKKLSQKLQAAFQHNIIIAGLWNGAIPIAHAKLLDNKTCALHPDNHAFVQEMFPTIEVSEQSLVADPPIATCSGPVSALHLMLDIVKQYQGENTVSAVQEILSCDQNKRSEALKSLSATEDRGLPAKLQELIQLMSANIEEPLSIDELHQYTGVSRRQIERLFQTHLNVSPSRYYLEIRVTNARRLLLQTQESITNISIACGFANTSHFSNCFKSFFGTSPSAIRQSLTGKNQ